MRGQNAILIRRASPTHQFQRSQVCRDEAQARYPGCHLTAGKKELFVQIQTADGKKVSLRVNGELGVRLTKTLVDDLEQLLGNGSVQLGGDGQKRMKRLAQQQLFKDAAAEAATVETPVIDAISEPELEPELALEEV